MFTENTQSHSSHSLLKEFTWIEKQFHYFICNQTFNVTRSFLYCSITVRKIIKLFNIKHKDLWCAVLVVTCYSTVSLYVYVLSNSSSWLSLKTSSIAHVLFTSKMLTNAAFKKQYLEMLQDLYVKTAPWTSSTQHSTCMFFVLILKSFFNT